MIVVSRSILAHRRLLLFLMQGLKSLGYYIEGILFNLELALYINHFGTILTFLYRSCVINLCLPQK